MKNILSRYAPVFKAYGLWALLAVAGFGLTTVIIILLINL
jgi:hypothetical protein